MPSPPTGAGLFAGVGSVVKRLLPSLRPALLLRGPAAERWRRRLAGPHPWLRATLIVVLASAVIFYCLSLRYYGTFLRGWDGQMYYAQLRSAVVDGDLDYRNELLQLTPNLRIFLDEEGYNVIPRLPDGAPANKYTAGWAVLSLPPFLVAHAGTLLLGGKADGYSPAYDVATSLWQLALCLAGLAAVALAVARMSGDRFAALAVFAGFWATNLAYYACVSPVMNHAASFAATALLLYSAWRLEQDAARPRAWLLAGLALCFTVLLRPTNLVLGILLVPAALRCLRAGANIRARLPLLAPVLGALAGAGIQLVTWRLSYGEWMLDTYAANGEGFAWSSPNFSGLLLSTRHGGWLHHPFYALGTVGLLVASLARHTPHRALFRAALLALCAHLYVHACWWNWWYGDSFGNRILIDALPLVILGTGLLLRQARGPLRTGLTTTVGALLAWNLLLTLSAILGFLETAPVGDPSYEAFLATPFRMLAATFAG